MSWWRRNGCRHVMREYRIVYTGALLHPGVRTVSGFNPELAFGTSTITWRCQRCSHREDQVVLGNAISAGREPEVVIGGEDAGGGHE